MLMDVFSFAVGGFIGTVMGFLLFCLFTVGKEADMQTPPVLPNECVPKNCTPYSCKAWAICDDKWSQSLNLSEEFRHDKRG